MAAENCLQIEKQQLEILRTGLDTNMQPISLEEYGKFVQNIHHNWTNAWWNKVTSRLAIETK